MLKFPVIVGLYLLLNVECFPHDEELQKYLQPDNVDDVNFKSESVSPSVICTRECLVGDRRVCYYQFTLEQYSVMGLACGSCPRNVTACFAPQCVPADGKEKMILTVNRRLPGPSIQVCKGDEIVVDVMNKLPGRSTAIHWHGIRQTRTPHMDGMPMVTQCPIEPGQVFRYKYKAENAGTFFWHSHDGLQKMDGIIGSLIIREPRTTNLNAHLYDRDLPSHVMLITDWMHESSDEHQPGVLKNNIGQEPDSYLINGQGFFLPTLSPTSPNNFKDQLQYLAMSKTPPAIFGVRRGLRYRFRVIGGTCLSCAFQIFVEGHRLQLINSDLDSLEPVTVDSAILTSGERFDFVIAATRIPSAFWIHITGLGACGRTHVVAILRYEGLAFENPVSPYPAYTGLPHGVILNPRNNVCANNPQNEICITQIRSRFQNPEGLLKDNPDETLILRFGFRQFSVADQFRSRQYFKFFLPYDPFENRIFLFASHINNITLAMPPSPLLTQLSDIPRDVFCSQECIDGTSKAHCECLQVKKIPLGSTVEIILVDETPSTKIQLSHPFHLHGYEFSVMEYGIFGDGDRKTQIDMLVRRLRSNPIRRSNILRKDTMTVPASGYAVGRIVAKNPGFWFLHCHFIYHLENGMALILQVGEPNQFPKVPHGFPTCGDYTPPVVDPL